MRGQVPSVLGPSDLLASFYTLSGAPNAMPPRHSIQDRIRAASSAGYSAIGMSIADLDRLMEDGWDPDTLASLASDHGIILSELETFSFSPALTDSEREAARRVFELGEKLHSDHVNVLIGLPPGEKIDVDSAAASFGELCDIARDHGLDVAFEFMPFKAVATLRLASRIVEGADRENGGLVLDSYHFYRGGSQLEDLERLSGDRVFAVQLSDVPRQPAPDLLVETRTARLLPGKGELPLVDFVRAIDRTGSRAPVGVEILSDELIALPVEEAATSTGSAARAVLAEARA